MREKQGGQSLIFLAIILPIIFICIGVAIDFGWLYLNQSRLQNSADAAAVAGASILVKDEQPLSDYTYTTFVANSDEGLQKLIAANTISQRNTDVGDEIAKEYAKKNLDAWLGRDITLVDTDSDAWNKIKFEKILYGQNTEDYSALYYTVTLSEKLDHLFAIMDYFDFINLEAKAMAAVKITHIMERTEIEYPIGPTLYDQMKAVEKKETYPTWNDISHERNAAAANSRSILTNGNYYNNGDVYRTELTILNGVGFSTSGGVNYWKETGEDQTKYDDFFIDFEPDQKWANYVDIDLNQNSIGAWTNYDDGLTVSGPSGNKTLSQRRIHQAVNVYTEYPVRGEKYPPDCLYMFIEQEPIQGKYLYRDGTEPSTLRANFSGIRQLIINVYVDNTKKSSGKYKDRPLILFYEGPEIPNSSQNSKVYDGDNYVGVRYSQPVILNLYKNFRGILFVPNSPVAINGNGYNWEGFVVASKFLRLKTAADFISEGYVSTTYNGNTIYFNPNKNVKYVKVTAADGNAYYIDQIKLSQNSRSADYPCRVSYGGSYYYVNAADLCPVNPSAITVKYNNKNYSVYEYYTKITEETYKFGESVNISNVSSTKSGGATIVKTSLNEMYSDRFGNIQYVELAKDDIYAKDEAEENPITPGTLQDDDTTRFYYTRTSTFNLDYKSRYNSFFCVGLVNYTYLVKNEFSTSHNSRDMFFTTPRSKHIY